MKKKLACIAIIGVLATLACTTASAGTQVKYFTNPDYGYSFTLSSSLLKPSPDYTSEYSTRITPDYQDGGYVHVMQQTISGSPRNWSHNAASYFLDTPGISRVRDSGSYRGFGEVTVVLV